MVLKFGRKRGEEISMVRYPPNTNWCMQNACSMPNMTLWGGYFSKIYCWCFFPSAFFDVVYVFLFWSYELSWVDHFFSFARVEAKRIKYAIFCGEKSLNFSSKLDLFGENGPFEVRKAAFFFRKQICCLLGRKKLRKTPFKFQRKGWDRPPREIKSWTTKNPFKKEDPIAKHQLESPVLIFLSVSHQETSSLRMMQNSPSPQSWLILNILLNRISRVGMLPGWKMFGVIWHQLYFLNPKNPKPEAFSLSGVGPWTVFFSGKQNPTAFSAGSMGFPTLRKWEMVLDLMDQMAKDG